MKGVVIPQTMVNMLFTHHTSLYSFNPDMRLLKWSQKNRENNGRETTDLLTLEWIEKWQHNARICFNHILKKVVMTRTTMNMLVCNRMINHKHKWKMSWNHRPLWTSHLITSHITHSHFTTSHITSRKKRTQRRSAWAEFWPLMAFLPHHTSFTSHHNKHHTFTKKKCLGRVLPPDGILTTSHILHISAQQTSHIHISPYHTSQAERREHKEEVLGPSSRAGWFTTPNHTSHNHISPYHTSQAERREHKEEVLGPSSYPGWHSHHITHHTSFTSHHITHHTFTSHHITHPTSFTSHHITHHSFTSHHITHHKPKVRTFTSHHITHHSFTSHHITHHKPKVRTSTSFIVKTPLRTIPDQRKVRELPPKMNIQEVEEPKGRKSTSFIVKTSLRSIRDQRKVRELPRKMNIEEVEEPETTKIYIQNPSTPAAATRKVRELPGKMHMQARKHENSDEFRPAPRSSTPAFYPYRKNPKC